MFVSSAVLIMLAEIKKQTHNAGNGIKMRLETDRLILRDWSKKDINDLVEGLNNLEVSKWLAHIPYPYTKRDAEEWINYCIKNAKKGKEQNSYYLL